MTRSIPRAFAHPSNKSPKTRRRFLPAVDRLEDRTVPSVAHSTAHLWTGGGALPAGGPGQPGGLSPAQVRHAYGFDQITFSNGTVQGDGTGQTIAIIDAYDQPNIASDLATFDAMYGIPAPPSFTKVNQTGGATYPTSDQTWGLEISLDVEWAHAIAPGASILLVEASSNSWSNIFAAVNYARQQPGVSVISMSLAGSEWSGETSYNSYFTTPSGHIGETFVAATGDNGSSSGAQFPSTSPNVVAVGGTQLSTDVSGVYLGETGWSGSTGGISAYLSQPGYQNGVVTQSSTLRTVPDVAYDGSSGSTFAVYDTSGYGGWLQVYGTSAGAPQWAALAAIADQGRALAGQGTLDGASQTLPKLYQLPVADFHDITSGSNGSYSAGPGYDLVTGLGSPLANLVVAGLVGISSPGTNQAPVITTPAGATPNPVTGTTTNLSVLGSDPDGDVLAYTWSVTSAPAGSSTSFSANGTSAARNSTATFSMAGSYVFAVTVADPAGLTATGSVAVTVTQTMTSIAVTPRNTSITTGGTLQFVASARDQFGNAMSTQPTFTWSLAAGALGTVSTGGLYHAPASGSGTDTVQATGGAMGSGTVSYGTAPAAPSNLTATVVSSRQVNLSWTDNASNETGFVIQRSADRSSWTQLATVGANVTSYSDRSVSKRMTYYYRVCATNSFGTSAYSTTGNNVTPSVQLAGAQLLLVDQADP
jgi:subtilase family serine protease